MKDEAEANAESDKLEKELVDKVNMADNLIFQTEKKIKEFSDKLTEEDKTALNTDLDEVRKSHSNKDVEKIDETTKKLNETWAQISTRLYQQQSEAPQEPQSDNTDTGNGNVEDADFEEVK